MATFCPICHEEIASETGIVTKCNHEFHETCLLKWIDFQDESIDKPTCPMCREEVKPVSLLSTERMAEYMLQKILKKMNTWMDDLKRDYATHEERCNTIRECFGRMPDIAAALINSLQ
jgi:hypothetical protein